jgi:hypothetical protein
MNQQLLDHIPLWAILAVLAILMLLAYELGYRLGVWWQERTPGEQEGPTGLLVGSLLALMAFVLAITMGMASDRFDRRRALVLDEASAIRSAYLMAGYLPGTIREQTRALLREYTPLRLATADLDTLAARFRRSEEIHLELWSIVEELVRTTQNTDITALFVEAVDQIVEVHEARAIAGLHSRVPETVVFLLLGGSTLTLLLVGYSAGITERRSLISAVALVVALSVVTVLVLDIDRPRDGIVQVSQQPLLDLERRIFQPTSDDPPAAAEQVQAAASGAAEAVASMAPEPAASAG